MRRWEAAICVLAIATLLGCSGGDKPKTASAGGTVTLDGSPVDGADVVFAPTDKARPSAIGKTDAAGKFKMTTTSAIQGVVPGDYQVGVSKDKTEGALTPEQSQEYFAKTGKAPPSPKVTNELPEKYRVPAKSGLTAKVEASGSNAFEFKLSK